jgi:glycogen debranching enzyme
MHIAKILAVFLSLGAGSAIAQQTLETLPEFPLSDSPIKITQPAQQSRPFSVAGERGAVFGQQDGAFELWLFPYKILQHTHLVAELDGYGVPIDLNKEAATIRVSPDRTTITYVHPAITVKQEMFAVRGVDDADLKVVVLFSIDATKPAMLTLQFEPVMAPMWPATQSGKPGGNWVKIGSGGGFVMATDDPHLYGMVAMPESTSGGIVPYQERPQSHPLEFKIRFDPKKNRGRFYPLIALIGDRKKAISEESQAELVQRVIAAESRIPVLYQQTGAYYEKFLDTKLITSTPNASFDLALKWAELAIDQCKVRFHDETGLIAGWYTSADSLRPGYGWFFGRDTLWTLYAVHSYGDFDLSRRALELLLARQRADGKIMHEFSQTADMVDWKSLPYWYAAADSTSLLVLVMEDYVRSSGDVEFLRNHWDNVKRAYAFTRAHDSDGDGIYDNNQGTGWVESWPPGGPNQELYLAALDEQSSESYARLAALMSLPDESSSAKKVADDIRGKLALYRGSDGMYAFSRNRDGSYDRTPTIYPSVAWWTGRLKLPDADNTLDRWASHEFFTDWGSRAVSDQSPVYDPISYHQGTVWPLFTGWSAMAEYRADRPLAGYAQLMSNLRLTYLQDPGAITELLSGDLYAPLGRSSSHQLWSSAMVLSPAIRGLFGLEVDELHHRVRLHPKLPATWDHASLAHVPYGKTLLDVSYTRRGGELEVQLKSPAPQVLCVDTQVGFEDTDCKEVAASTHLMRIKLPGVEVGMADDQSEPGERTHELKVVNEVYGARELNLRLESPAGTRHELPLRLNGIQPSRVRVEGARIDGGRLIVQFPAGSGYASQQVMIRW